MTTEKITVLTPSTKIDTILKEYPSLKGYLINISDKFSLLDSPMAKVMLKVATVKMVSDKTGIPIETLQEEFTKYLRTLE